MQMHCVLKSHPPPPPSPLTHTHPPQAHCEDWISDMALTPANERLLYTTCADTLAGCTRKPKTAAKEGYKLLTKCIVSYEVRASDGG